jgi:leucyl aminopeptidase
VSRAVAVPNDFDPVPSASAAIVVSVAAAVPAGARAVGVAVPAAGAVPALLGLSREAVAAAGFTGAPGRTLATTDAEGRAVIAVGTGDGRLDPAAVRDAAAAFALAAAAHGELALVLDGLGEDAAAAQAAVEGVLLARYEYAALRSARRGTAVTALTIVTSADTAAVTAGAERGAVLARATSISRDLANCPPAHLSAVRMAQVAERLGEAAGLTVEVFDRDALLDLRCGGLLGVNGGSTDEPRMVRLGYAPTGEARGRVALVGKGIMYDSGGISLKPADGTHATMKNDMSGAGALLAVMTVLRELDCPVAVTAYLMCTDNMPSGDALKMGDVITARNGTTVEVANTDAEGRLVMMDALVMAAEQQPDAIVDIATLTGASMRALGTLVAGVMGNDQALVERLLAAARQTDERAWQLPLERAYRVQLDSDVADISNLGGPNAGAITAALFLEEFVAGLPWAHVDIAGTAQADPAGSWRPQGCTGFGARLLAEFLVAFEGESR